MFEKVVALLAEYLGVDEKQVTRETDIKSDLDADSLVLVELLYTLQNDTGITIPDEDVEKLTKVGALVDYIEKNMAK